MDTTAYLRVLVRADGIGTTNAKLASVERSLHGAGSAAGTFGSRLGTALKYGTTAAVGFGAEAIKMGVNFQQSMGLISTQAGASQREVNRLSDAVLNLAKRSAFGPQELADALFHVESVGYRGAKAMHVLDAAQKLAVVGQSDLESTTYALVSAQETGIKGTEKLSKTIGTLNAIVGHGDMRMEDLTAALSSGILPAAKNFGLSMRDVGAALDTMTARGVPAQEAATRLRMTFSLLGAPSQAAAKALGTIGLNATKLGETMQHGGLIPALELLKSHLDRAGDAAHQAQVLSAAFGGGRTSAGIITLIQNLDDVKSRYDAIGKSSGDFNEKLRQEQQQPEFKLERALAQIQSMMTSLGGTLLPPVRRDLGVRPRLAVVQERPRARSGRGADRAAAIRASGARARRRRGRAGAR